MVCTFAPSALKQLFGEQFSALRAAFAPHPKQKVRWRAKMGSF